MEKTKNTKYVLMLLMITFWAALQYVFIQNVPDNVSAFSFMFITNAIGLIILCAIQFGKLKKINGKVLLKGLIIAAELIGFNFFMMIGSKGINSVVVSSIASMYFIFVTPILIIMKKRVSFRSAIASIVAVISLLLMFDAKLDAVSGGTGIWLLFLSDIFFAAYVVSVSVMGEKEDPGVLTICQMIFSSLLSLIGWAIQTAAGKSSFSFPADGKFWVSVIFISVFIRALYGLIQAGSQKYVKPVNASLIFSSEIIITLITNPIMSKIFHTEYTPASNYQIIGCVLFAAAALIADDTVMSSLGYNDMDTKVYIDDSGKEQIRSSISKKITNMTLIISMTALLITTGICVGAISSIRDIVAEKSIELGRNAADVSENSLLEELEKELKNTVSDKAMLAEEKLNRYISSARFAVDKVAQIYTSPDSFTPKEVMYPLAQNGGKWTMQRTLASEDIIYSDVSSEISLLGNTEETLRTIISQSDNISTVYIGMESGVLISYDTYSDDSAAGGELYWNFKETDWYLSAKNSDSAFFTKAYQDSYGRGLTITCVTPVTDDNGSFIGCVCMDILMNDINNSMVNDNIVNPNYAALIDSEGNIIAGKEVNMTTSGTLTVYDDTVNSPIKDVFGIVTSNDGGLTKARSGDDEIYISYSRIPLTDWVLCIMSPVSDIIKPAVSIRNDIDANTEQVAGTVNESIRIIIENCLVLFAVITLTITYVAGKFSRKITDPLSRLEADVLEISKGNFERRTNVDTDDEIGSLAGAFNNMTKDLQKYIADLTEAAVREERIASDLFVAAKIQADMLPSTFPAFPERKEFDIFASMTPAKEVGGDFYDFFLVDDNRLAMVMADVSGKGVPAALFMVISKTLIKNRAQMGDSPAQILRNVNEQLCEGNKAELFVTVWLAITDLSTGEGVAANAGHEHPALRRSGGKYELVVYRHSPAVAAAEGIKFREHTFRLNPGDSLFVYTDGVPEATNTNDELYGPDRMLKALNAAPDAKPERLLENVKRSVDEFVGEAPQFDDLTMLGFTYFGKGGV